MKKEHTGFEEQEKQRLKALAEYKMLNVPLEQELEGLTKMAALVCRTPVAYVSLIDEERLWFKSAIGISRVATPRETTYCWRTIAGEDIRIIPDTAMEGWDLFTGTHEGKPLRFYAGIPLRTNSGYNIGTLAVMDVVPRVLDKEQRTALELLAGEVISRLDLKLKYKDYQSGIKRVLEKKYMRLGSYHNAILDGTHYAVIFTDPQGIIKTFNAGAEKMLGYTLEDVVDKVTPALFHLPEELPDFNALIARAREGIADVNEWTYRRSDGSRLTVHLSVKSIQDEHDAVIGYLAIAEDISEKSRIEKKLKHSEERHRLFFENSQGIMFTHDPTGKILSLNKAGADFLGYTPGELIGLPVKDLLPSFFRQHMQRYLDALTMQGSDSGVVKLLHKDGSMRVGAYKNILIKDGTTTFVIGNATDISSRVELEKSLKKAKQLAERNATAKDNFLANMSHEIRTPMNAILGFTDVLANTGLMPEQAEYLDIIKTAGDNLLGLINDILDFSKIESGKISFESLPFSISESVKAVYDLLKVKAEAKGLEMELDLADNIPVTVMGDRLRLNQVMFNLVGNAVKFTEKGKISIAVQLLDEEAGRCRIQFVITDTGIGIPKDRLDHVFERFTQVSDETTRKYGGTGLGLSISKNLVALQHGKLAVESALGKGSRFSFYLPFQRSGSGQWSREGQKTLFKDPAATLKLLLVEDNVLNQKLAVKVITGFGYTVEVADNGRIGVEKLRKNSYDLVLMDLQMPEMDGYQATMAIRNELKLDVPVMAMTAHSLVGEKDKCLEAGMNDYLAKPFKAEELYYKINSLVKKKEGILQEKIKPAPVLKVVDMSYLKELSGGSTEFELEMIGLFLQNVPVDLSTMEQAIAAHDNDLALKMIHKLKSSFSLFNLKSLLKKQEQLGAMLRDGSDIKDRNTIFAGIKNDLDEVFRELQELVRTGYET